MDILKINSVEDYNRVINSEFVAIKFYADWCQPCKVLTKNIYDVADVSVSGLHVYEINVDDDFTDEIVEENNIRNLPTIIFYKNGEAVGRKTGMVTTNEFITFANSL